MFVSYPSSKKFRMAHTVLFILNNWPKIAHWVGIWTGVHGWVGIWTWVQHSNHDTILVHKMFCSQLFSLIMQNRVLWQHHGGFWISILESDNHSCLLSFCLSWHRNVPLKEQQSFISSGVIKGGKRHIFPEALGAFKAPKLSPWDAIWSLWKNRVLSFIAACCWRSSWSLKWHKQGCIAASSACLCNDVKTEGMERNDSLPLPSTKSHAASYKRSPWGP